MFDKKCPRCNTKVKKSFDFCPLCGYKISSISEKEDYGILGKNDFIDSNIMPQGFNDTIMDKMFNNAFKMAEKLIEKQMKSMSENMVQKQYKENINNKQRNMNENFHVQFFVNGKKVFPNNNQAQISENRQIQEQKEPRQKLEPLSQDRIERYSKLPKKDPASKVRRLGGIVIYEIEVPGVIDIKDVMINKLESSIEIKALAKDVSYAKILNVNLPLLRYKLDKENLILELQAR